MDRNQKITVAKFVVSSITTIGASKIAGQIIKNNIAPKNTIDKVLIFAGAFVIGVIVSNAVKKQSEQMIDEVVETWDSVRGTLPQTDTNS